MESLECTVRTQLEAGQRAEDQVLPDYGCLSDTKEPSGMLTL